MDEAKLAKALMSELGVLESSALADICENILVKHIKNTASSLRSVIRKIRREFRWLMLRSQ